MSGQFVARRGLIALGDTTITGSLNISQNIITAGTIQGTFDGSTSTAISGAFDSVSASLASDISLNASSINSLNAASSSYALEANISGSFNSVSSSLASDISLNAGSISSLNAASSSYATINFVTSSYLPLSGGNITGNFTVDTNTLYVDATNNRVGVGIIPYNDWRTDFGLRAIQIGPVTSISSLSASETNNQTSILSNCYIKPDGSRQAIKNDASSELLMFSGNFIFANSTVSTSGSDSVQSERMRIDTSGNVGIGTTNPILKLDVNGSSFFRQDIRVGADAAGPNTAVIKWNSESFPNPDALGIYTWADAKNIQIGGLATIFRVESFAATERARIDNDGLKFNGDTAAANALDDYEEGTWTPVWSFSEGGSATVFVDSAIYTKIGNIVSINARFYTTGLSSASGDATLTGLPFAVSGYEPAGSIGQVLRWNTDMPNLKIRVSGNSNIIFSKQASNSFSGVSLNASDFSASSGRNIISISLVYHT